MIFSVDNNSDPKEIVVYDDIDQLASMVEWQDVLDTGLVIIDSDGNIYVWDDTKDSEIGATYDYSMKVVGTNTELANKCKQTYERQHGPTEFFLDE